MSEVVDELLEPEELDGAQRAPVPPVDVDLQLARFLQGEAEPDFRNKNALKQAAAGNSNDN